MAELDDLIKKFLIESCENLDRLDQGFVALEKDSSDRNRLGSIFQTMHTRTALKGPLKFTLRHLGGDTEIVLVEESSGKTSPFPGAQIVDNSLRAVRELLGITGKVAGFGT